MPNYEQRDPAPKYQLPFTADDSMKFIQVPAEFKLELFAKEPDIIEPIAFNFDERGRLWIIEAIDYPNVVLNGNPGDDRIKIVEDTNGDGRADKFTVFAEHLNLPTSLVFANGGVDRDGGAAHAVPERHQRRRQGGRQADSQHRMGHRATRTPVPSSLMYGPDNHIWGTVGYSRFNGPVGRQVVRLRPGRLPVQARWLRLRVRSPARPTTPGASACPRPSTCSGRPRTTTRASTWRSPTATSRASRACRCRRAAAAGSAPAIRARPQFYNAHYVTPYIRQVDVFGGYTAGAGHQLYTARAFPKPYWNRIAFINEPTAHLVGQGIIEKRGAGFVTRDGWNLLAGAEEWVAPVQAQVGPDGAVWVSDWYNFIGQHNPTPQNFSNGAGNAYETSMRDESRGRIYRVVYRGAPPQKKLSLSKNNAAGLVAALSSDNMLWRLHAQRLLVERDQKDVVPQLLALVRNKSVDEIGLNGAALHALWTLHGLGELSSLTSEAGKRRGRRAEASGRRRAEGGGDGAAEDRRGGQRDCRGGPARRTRICTPAWPRLLVMADAPPSPELGRLLYKASSDADNYNDRWLSRAMFIAATRHKAAFLARVQGGSEGRAGDRRCRSSLRIGATKPDWRTPDSAALSSDWKEMQVPGNWETRGLEDFDGVVWFTRTVDVPGARRRVDASSLGRVSNNAEVWVNGLSVSAAPGGGRGAAPPAGGGRGNAPPIYELPPGR